MKGSMIRQKTMNHCPSLITHGEENKLTIRNKFLEKKKLVASKENILT